MKFECMCRPLGGGGAEVISVVNDGGGVEAENDSDVCAYVL